MFEFLGNDVKVSRAGKFAEGAPPADAQVPGSKSLTNRYLLLGALAEGTSTLRGALECEDSRAMASALRELGCKVTWKGPDMTISGRGGHFYTPVKPLFIENAGTAMRFLLAVGSLLDQEIVLDGNRWMRQRPQSDLTRALEDLGVKVEFSGDQGKAPIHVRGPLKPGVVELPGQVSSQFLSALLMALPHVEGNSEIQIVGPLVSRTYVDMTLTCLQHVGVTIETESDRRRFLIKGKQKVHSFDVEIEPDASTASYWLALPFLTGRKVQLNGIPARSDQGDFGLLNLLKRMGAILKNQGTTWFLESGALQGMEANMNTMSDIAPTLAVIATQAESPTLITDVGNMRVKECDRIAVLQKAFDQMGLQMESGSDWMRITPGNQPPANVDPVILDPHQDHRMAMVFTLLGLRYGNVIVKDYSCVEKTYPAFYKHLAAVCQP